MNEIYRPNLNRAPQQPGFQRRQDKFVRHNWKIKAAQVRLVKDGAAPEIMSTSAAVERAKEAGMDLVEVNYDFKSGISTCKICDYGKYMYDMKRREKTAKKQARAAEADVKCLQISLTIDTADLDRVVRRGHEFIEAGDKVKLSLRLRGRREMANIAAAKDVMAQVMSRFEDVAVVEQQPQLNGREFSCLFRKGKAPSKNPGKVTIVVN